MKKNVLSKLMLNVCACIVGLFFAGLQISNAQVVEWRPNEPNSADVNVGSPNSSALSIYFETIEKIENAKLTVQIQETGDFYESSNPVTYSPGSVNWGTPSWNGGTRTLEFPATTIEMNKVIRMNIPHRATDLLPSNVNAGKISIKIQGDNISDIDTFITYNYKRVMFQIVPASSETNLTLNFGANNGSHSSSPTIQTYKFGLKTGGGTGIKVNNAKVEFIIRENVATLSNWQCDGVTISSVSQNTVSGTTTYTLSLDQTHSVNGDGFDNGELVNISVDAIKTYCGTNPVELQAYWGGSTTPKYVVSTKETGSLAADPSGIPELKRAGTVASSGWTMPKFDNTPNLITTSIENLSSNGPATNVRLRLYAGYQTYANYIDINTIKYRINGGAWTAIPTSLIEVRTGRGTYTNYIPTSDLSGKPIDIWINVPANIPANGKLDVEYGICIPTQPFTNSAGKERTNLVAIRVDENWEYIDLCRATPKILSGTVQFTRGTMVSANMYTNPVVLKSADKQVKLANLTVNAMNDGNLSNPTSYFEIVVTLPKGIKLVNSGGVDGIKLGSGIQHAGMQDNSNASNNIYKFKYIKGNSYSGDLVLNYHPDCADGGNVNVSGLVDVAVNYAPTGTINGSGSNVLMPKIAQLYTDVSLNCNQTGVTYDFDIERLTVGYEDKSPENKIADNTNPASSADITHTVLFVNDEANLYFKGEVKGSFNYLYAVLLTDAGTNYTINTGAAALSGSASSGATVKYKGSGTVSGKTAHVWEIEKVAGFNASDLINLTVPFKASLTSGSVVEGNPPVYQFTSWYYASSSQLSNISNMLNISNRTGDEEYTIKTTFLKTITQGWNDSPFGTLAFSGAETKPGQISIVVARGSFSHLLRSKEHRHIATADSILITAPFGYKVEPTMNVQVSGTNINITRSVTAKASSTANRAVFELGASIFDVTYSDGSKIPLPDGQYTIRIYPKFKSSNLLSEGTVQAVTTAYMRSTTTNTNTNGIPQNNGTRTITSTNMVFSDAGSIKLEANDPLEKNAPSSQMSWNLNVNNTKGTPIYDAWFYFKGNVKDASIKYNGTTFTGEGENNKWVKIPQVNAGILAADFNCTLTTVGCSDTPVEIYPVLNTTCASTGCFTPSFMTDAGFATELADYNAYIYKKQDLKALVVPSSIAGKFTDWADTPLDPANPTGGNYGLNGLDVNTSASIHLPVEMTFDASSSSGNIAKVKAEITFPKGLNYVANSAYIEYDGVNTAVSGACETALQGLISVTTPTLITINLEDMPASAGLTDGIMEAGKKAYLRFKIAGDCNISMQAEEITAKFYAKRACDYAIDVNGSGSVNERSNPLLLLNPYIAFRSDMNVSSTVQTLICEPGKDVGTFTFDFKKLTKLDLPLTNDDSVRIAIPVSLGVVGNISYSFPAYSTVNAISGVVGPNDYSEQVINDSIRHIAWQLPINYYTDLTGVSLTASGDVTGIYSFDVKANQHIRTAENVFIQSSTLTQVGPGGDCPTITAVADTSDRKYFILEPSQNATLTRIYVNGDTIVGFNPNRLEYDILLPCGTEWININGIPYSDCADVYGVYNGRLERYFKRFEVFVHAEDGIHTQTYVVNARPMMPAQILEDIPAEMTACQSIDFSMNIIAEGDSLTYQWFMDDNTIQGATTNSLLINNPQQPTDYGLFHIKVNGACQSADTSTVSRLWVANKLPEQFYIDSIPETVYTNQRYKAHVGFEYGYQDITSYCWSFTDTTGFTTILSEGYPGQTIRTYIPGNISGTLRVDLEHPCAAHFGPYFAEKELIVINNTNIDNVLAENIEIYPNPFENELHISSGIKIESVVITDLSGRRISSYYDPETSGFTIHTSSWAKGTYLITINTESGTFTSKAVKK